MRDDDSLAQPHEPNVLAPRLADTLRDLVGMGQELVAERTRRIEAESDRDTYHDWAVALMAEVHRLTQITRLRTATIARLNETIRRYIAAPTSSADRRVA